MFAIALAACGDDDRRSGNPSDASVGDSASDGGDADAELPSLDCPFGGGDFLSSGDIWFNFDPGGALEARMGRNGEPALFTTWRLEPDNSIAIGTLMDAMGGMACDGEAIYSTRFTTNCQEMILTDNMDSCMDRMGIFNRTYINLRCDQDVDQRNISLALPLDQGTEQTGVICNFPDWFRLEGTGSRTITLTVNPDVSDLAISAIAMGGDIIGMSEEMTPGVDTLTVDAGNFIQILAGPPTGASGLGLYTLSVE
ncbi:MAG: hypothetical protein AAGF12_23795 [Myxococcota bacterium]